MIRYMEAMSEGAVGTRDNLCIAEYKSAVSADAYHLVIYNKASGALMASVYDKSVETFEQYLVGKNGRDGAAILTAMMPALLEDEEFNSHFVSYKDHMDMQNSLRLLRSTLKIVEYPLMRRKIGMATGTIPMKCGTSIRLADDGQICSLSKIPAQSSLLESVAGGTLRKNMKYQKATCGYVRPGKKISTGRECVNGMFKK